MNSFETVDAVGGIINSLYSELGDIRAQLGAAGGREHAALLATLDQAEAALRARAEQLTTTAQVASAQSLREDARAWQEEREDRRHRPRSVPRPSKGLPRPKPPQPVDPLGLTAMLSSESARPPLGRPLRAPQYGTRIKEKPTLARRLLPMQNRLDPLAEPPVITEDDLAAGLYDLGSRGFIPPAVDLTPAMERGRPVALRRQAKLFGRTEAAGTVSAVRMDVGDDLQHSHSAPQLRPASRGRGNTQQALLPLQQGSGSGTFFTELAEAPETQVRTVAVVRKRNSMSSASHLSLTHIKHQAATKIQARVRGQQERRRYAYTKRCKRSVLRVQKTWKLVVVPRIIARRLLKQKTKEDIRVHAELMREYGQAWDATKSSRIVEVHICSNTIEEYRRSSMQGFRALQAAQIGRIFRVLEEHRDVVLVAPFFLEEELLDYYSQLMQLRGIAKPSSRFQIVVPECMGLSEHLSLTQALLVSPRALARLSKLVAGRRAVIVPGATATAEIRLCSALRLPLLGAVPAAAGLTTSKAEARRVCELAQLPTGPWTVGISSEDDFYERLAGLIMQHPGVRRWLAKIDNERQSRGHVCLDMQKMRKVSRVVAAARRAAAQGAPGDTSETRAQVLALLRRHVPGRAVVCNDRAYKNFAEWMAEAAAVGAVIQAVPNHITAQASVHIQIDPGAKVQVLGSSEPVMCAPFVCAASWLPHTRGSWEVLCDAGVRAGKALGACGYVGFASVDVVFHTDADDASELRLQSRAQDSCTEGEETEQEAPALPLVARPSGHDAGPSQKWWVVDVDPRLTDAAAALWPLFFVAEVRPDPATGLLLRPSKRPPASAAEGETVPPPPPPEECWALFNHVAYVPGLAGVSCTSLFRTAGERGVVFDSLQSIGCVFEFLDIEYSMFSLLSVDRTPEACAVRLAKAVCLIAECPGITEGGPRARPGPPGAPEERDGLRASDVQRAMRDELRRWSGPRARSPSPPRQLTAS